MGGFSSIRDMMLKMKQLKEGDQSPGQQYTYDPAAQQYNPKAMKNGGKVKSSASKRADGIAQRGKTKGRMA
jgi:hypothetical protein